MSDDPSNPMFGRPVPHRPSGHEFATPNDTRPIEPRPAPAVVPQYEPQQITPRQDHRFDEEGHLRRTTQVPEGPRSSDRSRKARGGIVRLLNFLLTIGIIGAGIFGYLAWSSKEQFEERGPLAQRTTYEVANGATFNGIIPDLEKANIIQKQGRLCSILRVCPFKLGIKQMGKGSALKKGEFAFQPGMSMRQVVLHLTEGKPVERKIGFPEGWTSQQIFARVMADERLVGDTPPVPSEGSLLPNTYSFPNGTTRDQILLRMRDAQAKAIREVWANRAPDLPVNSVEELVVLASIIEKETGVASERPRVASVFVNRLRKGMKLQTDPTVIYGIWGGAGKPKDRGGLRRSELQKPTPYNTYIISGLPPGPIANPGIESLKAAANPLKTDDLFFVADGTGGHVFAPTLKEHNANVKKWREIEAQRKKDAQAATQEAEPNGVVLPPVIGSDN